MIRLTPADPGDDRLREALLRYWRAMGLQPDPEWLARYFALMADEAAAGRRLVYWCEVAGLRVGFAIGRLVPDWLFPERLTGYVAEVGIFPGHRLRGYGRGAALALVERLRAAGADAVELDVLPDNRGAQRFWARLGFRPAFIRYRR